LQHKRGLSASKGLALGPGLPGGVRLKNLQTTAWT
jgi:hypothetical protein